MLCFSPLCVCVFKGFACVYYFVYCYSFPRHGAAVVRTVCCRSCVSHIIQIIVHTHTHSNIVLCADDFITPLYRCDDRRRRWRSRCCCCCCVSFVRNASPARNCRGRRAREGYSVAHCVPDPADRATNAKHKSSPSPPRVSRRFTCARTDSFCNYITIIVIIMTSAIELGKVHITALLIEDNS